MRRLAALLVWATLLSAASAGPALACRPVYTPDARAQSDQSDVVFTGRVIEIERRRLDSERVLLITRFEVWNAIKGRQELQREVVQIVARRPFCGGHRTFERGKSYLVLANIGEDGMLYTSALMAPMFPQADFEALKPPR